MLWLRNIGLLTITLLIASGALGASPPHPPQPSPEETERESLRGLSGVEIRVESLDDDIEQRGLSEGKIEQAIRQRLQKAGVKVLTDRERLATPTAAILIVRVD